tara:strand:+ start:6104 stop:6532 length:429 start_codon:yes stop_codon:yes gene_type:complete
MEDILHGTHSAKYSNEYGDWRILDIRLFNDLILELKDIQHFLTDDKIKILKHKDIGWKGRHLDAKRSGSECICCDGVRYRECDPRYPGIVLDGGPNPYKKRYRMIDGKHRISKLSHTGIRESPFYVLDYETIKPYFKIEEEK